MESFLLYIYNIANNPTLIDPKNMARNSKNTRMIYAASKQSADLYYKTKFHVPDPVLWFEISGKSYLLLSPLEVDRGRESAMVDHILSLSDISEEYKSLNPESTAPLIEELAVFLCNKYKIRKVEVSPWFPLFLADTLRSSKIKVSVCDPLCPQRRKKSVLEIAAITKGQRQAEAGMRRGIEIITAAKVRKDGKLLWGGGVLTSESLRFEIENAVRLAGGVPDHTIVSAGVQSCDPHEAGFGPISAGETIILDIFPHDSISGYFGDLTRTVLKGRASEAQRRLYHTVKKAQKSSIQSIKAGVDGARLQNRVKDEFASQGYPTENRDGRWVGFFHGLGHGLGLEIHEAPRIAAGRLKVGDVITVEPGLYYPEIGGVRLENVVVVESDRNRDITKVPYRFEIP